MYSQVCKVCKEKKYKKAIKKGIVYRFVDELNRLWNGKMCPDCFKGYNKEKMREARGYYSSSESSECQPSPEAHPSSESSDE